MINKILYLVIKSIQNPKKFLIFFKKRFLTIPSLDFLHKIKSKKIKFIYINFWFYFSKKNLSFKNLFFNTSEKYHKNIFNFNKKNIIDNDIIKSLSYNGVVIIENILNNNDLINLRSKIKEIESFKKKKQYSLLKNYKIDISEDKKRERFIYDPEELNYEELNDITERFSDLVYGKTLKPNRDLYIDYCYEIPEAKVRGDNFLHVDRFVPNLKILFAPFEITENDAPFSYALNSHKINLNYKNFIASASNFDETDPEVVDLIKYQKKITLKSNSAIIALTNGLHGRTSFQRKGQRVILFHQFNRSFTKLSLLNYLRFNRNNKYFAN